MAVLDLTSAGIVIHRPGPNVHEVWNGSCLVGSVTSTGPRRHVVRGSDGAVLRVYRHPALLLPLRYLRRLATR